MISETNSQALDLPPTSAPSRLVAAVVGAIAVVVSLLTVGAVLLRADQPYWMVVGFEVVVLGAGVYGLLIARGRFRDGPGMALLCVAGTLLVAGVLGFYSTKSTPGAPAQLMLRGTAVPMKPWAMLHIGGALLLAGASAFEVLRRSSRSMYYMARAAMAGVPLAALAVAAVMLYRRSQGAKLAYESAVEAAIMQNKPVPAAPDPFLPEWVTWLGGSLGAVLALVLFCACAHCIIRAFEMGRGSARNAQA
ncbi:MAG TPA: hypothetical protein VHN77_05300 [Phycisphaerales bacterium]|nr:hypothetical protein [Phycisphaerales bacterium]